MPPRGTVKTIKLKHRTSFFQRHGRLLSFVGAFVVFGTFVLKDAVREQLKILVDSISSAQSFYLRQRDMADIQARLSVIDQALSINYRNVEALRTHKEPLAPPLADWFYATDAYNHESTTSLDQMNQLMKVLPYDHALSSRREILIARLSKNKEDDRRLASETAYVDGVPDQDASANRKRAEGHLLEAVAVSTESAEIADATRTLVKDLLAHAEVTQAKAERRYRICTWVSYVLYTLGWSLALLGRIFSVEGLPGLG